MLDLIYSISVEKASSLQPPFTFELLLPKEYVPVNIQELYRSRMWIIATSKAYGTLVGLFFPESIFEINSETKSIQYMIAFDLLRSSYFALPGKVESIPWERPTEHLPIKLDKFLTPASDSQVSYLSNWMEQAREKAFGFPDKKRIQSICMSLKIDTSTSFLLALDVFKRNVLASCISVPVAGPFRDDPYLWWLSFFLDGLYRKQSEFEIQKMNHPDSSKALETPIHYRFDSRLNEVNEHLLVSRRYIKRMNDEKDHWGPILAKTERAEESHNAILRDTICFLISRRVTPLQSSSIDLAVKADNKYIIFEVKSANIDNFFEQCCRALVQISYYAFLLGMRGEVIMRKCVLIESCGNFHLENEMKEYLSSNGITLFTYHKEIAWPRRIQGAEDLLRLLSNPLHEH